MGSGARNTYTSAMNYILVEDSTVLGEVCGDLVHQPWITLDTEFTRERTFRARLGLLQIATPERIVCIDPLRVDLGRLLDTLYDPRLTKVLHAGRQDLEVFYDLRGEVLGPIFDTQIAAALLGYSEQMGYAALVEAVTGIKLPKLHTRTNWESRPLSEEQLRYAAEDVAYLRDVYDALRERLVQTGRLAWHTQECAALANPALYRSDPETAYQRIAGGRLSREAQPRLKALAAWREQTAQSRDRPRAWVCADAVLIEVARLAPDDLDSLVEVPGITESTVNKYGEQILESVHSVRDAPPEAIWPASEPPNPRQQDLVRRMLDRVKSLAQAEAISPGIIATRRSVIELIRDRCGPLTEGWRRELIGDQLLAMVGDEN